MDVASFIFLLSYLLYIPRHLYDFDTLINAEYLGTWPGLTCSKNRRTLCKVVIYNYVLCWLYSLTNLILILFDLLYPVFMVGFNCKGCVIER